MEFSQWKDSMESEATHENKELKEKIKQLEEENAKLKRKCQAKAGDKNLLIEDCKALANRCYILSNGLFCGQHCQLKCFECKHKREAEKELMAIAREAYKEYRNNIINS